MTASLRVLLVQHSLGAVCVAVEASEGADAESDPRLHPEERRLAQAMSSLRRHTFALGRVALREAMNELGVAPTPVLTGPGGEPLLPAGVAGSISHKSSLAVAIAARTEDEHLGVDVELFRARRYDLSARVLTKRERARLSHLAADDLEREVLTRFCIKEAVYKALYPFVRRYVGFQEIEADTQRNGDVVLHFLLEHAEGHFASRAHWQTCADLSPAGPAILSMVRLRRGEAFGSRAQPPSETPPSDVLGQAPTPAS